NGDTYQLKSAVFAEMILPVSLTANGTPSISTSIKKFGNSSLFLNGQSYLSTPHNSDFDISGDFTIDFWIYPIARAWQAGISYCILATANASPGLFISWNTGNNNENIAFYHLADGYYGPYAVDILTSSDNVVPIFEWTNVTITRTSNIIKLFINNVEDVTVESDFNFTTVGGGDVWIGADPISTGRGGGDSSWFAGYIDEFRLVNGVSNEPTPPPQTTPSPTPTVTPTNAPIIQSTNLFLRMDSENPFIDSISPERRIINNGKEATMSTIIQKSGVGSLLLNPSGDSSYLSIPINVRIAPEPGSPFWNINPSIQDNTNNSNFELRDDFTIDFWMRPTAIPLTKYSYLFTNSSINILWNYDSNTYEPCSINIEGILNSSANIAPLNEWTHVTITRNSDILNIYINGLLNNSIKYLPTFPAPYTSQIRIGAGSATATDRYKGGLAYPNFHGYIDEFKFTVGVANDPMVLSNDNRCALLLHFDGSEGSTTFTDSSPLFTRITKIGDPFITTSVSKFGGSCVVFSDQSADALRFTGNNSYYGPGIFDKDFTVEMWVQFSSTNTPFISLIQTVWGVGGFGIWRHPDFPDKISVWVGSYSLSQPLLVSTTSVEPDIWYHVAFTRSGNINTLWINGINESRTINSITTNRPVIGIGIHDNDFGEYGTPYSPKYVDEVRITKGISLYSSNFSVPTSAFTCVPPAPSPTPTPTVTPTVTPTPMVANVCSSGPTINLGSGRNTGYINYVGSGCVTNRVISLSGSTGGGTLISSGDGPLIFTSNLAVPSGGNKVLTLDGTNTGRNRVNRLRNPFPNGNGNVRLIKSGTGTWEIAGASGNYAGGTTILEGKLIVSGANINGAGNLNGPLGVGTIILGNSGINSTGSASLLLEEGVVFNRNIILSVSNPSPTDPTSCIYGCDPGPSWVYPNGRRGNLEDSIIDWRPSQELIIGGANSSGVCTFGSGMTITALRPSTYGELNVRAATGGTVIIDSDLGYYFNGVSRRGTIIFGSPSESEQGTITISSGTTLSQRLYQAMSIVLNGGTLNVESVNPWVIEGYFIILRGKLKIREAFTLFYANDKGLVLGDYADNIHDFAEIEVTYRMGQPYIYIPPLGTNSTQKIYLTASGGGPVTIDSSWNGYLFMCRPITIRAVPNCTLNWLMPTSSINGLDNGNQDIYIGSENYTGTVVSSYATPITYGSIIINYGTYMTPYFRHSENERTGPAVLDGKDDSARLVYFQNSNIGIYPLTKLIFIKGTLSGNGPISVPLVVGSGQRLYPGNSANDCNVRIGTPDNSSPLFISADLNQVYNSGISLNSGGKLRIDILNSAGSLVSGTDYNCGTITNSGVFINSTESEPFIIEVYPTNNMSDNTFTIISNSGVLDSFDSNKFTIVNNNPLVSGTFSLESDQSNIVLTYKQPIETQSLLLLHMDDLSTDSGKYSLPITANGSVSINSVEKVVGSGSVYFNGTDGQGGVPGYLSYPPSGNLFDLGLSKFTVDFWIRPNNIATTYYQPVIELATGFNQTRFNISMYQGKIVLANHTILMIANSGLTANQWHHVALVRESTYANKTILYLNGIPDTSGTIPINFSQSIYNLPTQLLIGSSFYLPAPGEGPFTGHIDELRIIKEVMYSGVFIPSTTPYNS
ncbi:hypothetical protein EB001_10155, partial [bacterium]|nr:hypothetical protein [bacterium]